MPPGEFLLKSQMYNGTVHDNERVVLRDGVCSVGASANTVCCVVLRLSALDQC